MAKGMNTRTVKFEEIGATYVTYINDPDKPLTNEDIGKVVVLVGDKTVGLGSDGKEVLGILSRVEDDGYVSVQDAGYKEDVAYSVEPAISDKVVSDGQGKIKPASEGKGRHTVISKDIGNQTVILKID